VSARHSTQRSHRMMSAAPTSRSWARTNDQASRHPVRCDVRVAVFLRDIPGVPQCAEGQAHQLFNCRDQP
jgi:hypothetical protein